MPVSFLGTSYFLKSNVLSPYLGGQMQRLQMDRHVSGGKNARTAERRTDKNKQHTHQRKMQRNEGRKSKFLDKVLIQVSSSCFDDCLVRDN